MDSPSMKGSSTKDEDQAAVFGWIGAIVQWLILSAALAFFTAHAVELNSPLGWLLLGAVVVICVILGVTVATYGLRGKPRPRWVMYVSLIGFLVSAGLGSLH